MTHIPGHPAPPPVPGQPEPSTAEALGLVFRGVGPALGSAREAVGEFGAIPSQQIGKFITGLLGGTGPSITELAPGVKRGRVTRDAQGRITALDGVPVGKEATVEALTDPIAPLPPEGPTRPPPQPREMTFPSGAIAILEPGEFGGETIRQVFGPPPEREALTVQKITMPDGREFDGALDSEGNLVEILGEIRDPAQIATERGAAGLTQQSELAQAQAQIDLLRGQLEQLIPAQAEGARAGAAASRATAATQLAEFLTTTAASPRRRILGGAGLGGLIEQDPAILQSEVGQLILSALGVTSGQARTSALGGGNFLGEVGDPRLLAGGAGGGGTIPGTRISPVLADLFFGPGESNLRTRVGGEVPSELGLRAIPRLSAFSPSELEVLAPFLELEGTSLADIQQLGRSTASGAGGFFTGIQGRR